MKIRSLSTLVLIAMLAFVGCGASQKQVALQANLTTYHALAGVQDSVDTLCDDKVLSADNCQKFNAALVPALQAGKAFNDTIRAERSGSLGSLITAVGQLTQAVTQFLPPNLRQSVLDRLSGVLQLAFQEAK